MILHFSDMYESYVTSCSLPCHRVTVSAEKPRRPSFILPVVLNNSIHPLTRQDTGSNVYFCAVLSITVYSLIKGGLSRVETQYCLRCCFCFILIEPGNFFVSKINLFSVSSAGASCLSSAADDSRDA